MNYDVVCAEAYTVGMHAGREIVPTPMVVKDELSGHVYEPIMDGVCGFGWIHFAGNTPFGRYAKKAGIARSDYPKGLCIWVSEFNQSYTRKVAFAKAYAAVLVKHGIEAYGTGRLD